MHKSYQPDTERRKQAQRISMMGDPAPDVLDTLPWGEVIVWAAGLAVMALLGIGGVFAVTGAM